MSKRIYLAEGTYATVDEKDYRWLNLFSWRVNLDKDGRPHAVRTMKVTNEAGRETARTRSMERDLAVIGSEGDEDLFKQIHHANGNTIDNRRENLRIGRPAPKSRSIPKPDPRFNGITYDARKDRWIARIKVKGVFVYGGRFRTAEEAARAFNTLALRYRGEKAKLNVFA